MSFHSRHLSWFIAGFVVVTACTSSPPAQAPSPTRVQDVIPFTASSLGDTLFAFIGDFHGGITVTDDSVLIYLAPAMILNQPRKKGLDWPRVLGSVTAGLATMLGPDRGWKIVTERIPLRIDKLVGVGESVDLPVSRFSFPRPRDRTLAAHWLVFEIADETTYESRPNHRVGYSYIHAPRTLLLAYRELR